MSDSVVWNTNVTLDLKVLSESEHTLPALVGISW